MTKPSDHPESRSPARGAFTLTELLVTVSIVLVLMALVSGAVAGARGSQRKQATQALIAKLDAVIRQQFSTYASRTAPGATSATARAVYLRRLASAEMPDNWADVMTIASGSAAVPTSAQQAAYVGVLTALRQSGSAMSPPQSRPTSEYGDAECLFMIVMQGGIADCLDCRMSRIDVGDQDGDNMPEFLDAWGMPIGFVLWPTGLRLPAGSAAPFFASAPPFDSAVPSLGDAKGGLLRPLIFSMGPDRAAGYGTAASPLPGATECADNITNFEQEATR